MFEVAEILGINESWLDNGPSSDEGGLFQLGLPEGLTERLTRREFGSHLTVYFIGRFDQIRAELASAFKLHEAAGTTLGGVHFELTGDDVTECVGGPQELSEHDLARSYQTYCDPRLNYAQSLELAFLLARRLQKRRGA